jgi:aspartate/methionine/tyrosine aminotransferase
VAWRFRPLVIGCSLAAFDWDKQVVFRQARRDVFVMPGGMMNAEGYFRISLTASDEMIARALPAFETCAK